MPITPISNNNNNNSLNLNIIQAIKILIISNTMKNIISTTPVGVGKITSSHRRLVSLEFSPATKHSNTSHPSLLLEKKMLRFPNNSNCSNYKMQEFFLRRHHQLLRET